MQNYPNTPVQWPEYLYHYNNEYAAFGILATGLIYKSSFDVVHGEGVYLTDLPPSVGKEAILLNNYGRTKTSHGVEKDRANWCFKFKTSELVGACFKNVRGRIIWKYPENIDLYNHWFASGKTEEEESAFEVHVPKWQDCVVSQNFAPQSPYCSQSHSFFTTPIVPQCCTAGSVSHNLQTCNFSSAASYQPMCCEQYGSHQYQGNVIIVHVFSRFIMNLVK